MLPNKTKMLIRIIEEEIEAVLMEQAAPPAAPAPPASPPAEGTPPADPSNLDGGDTKEEDKGDTGDPVTDLIKKLSGMNDKISIKQTILSMLQGGDRETALKVLGKIKDNEETDMDVSINLQDVVDDLIHIYGHELESQVDDVTQEEGIKEQPPAKPLTATPQQPSPQPSPQPLKESKVQMLSREYLKYRTLYLRAGGKL